MTTVSRTPDEQSVSPSTASLFEQISEEIVHVDRPVDRALRAVLAPHEPEQHYVTGQDNRQQPSFLYCRSCRRASPCPPLLIAARELGVALLKEGSR